MIGLSMRANVTPLVSLFHVKQILVLVFGGLLSSAIDANPVTTPEKVTFPSLEETNPTALTGYLYKPAKPAENKPAIVLAHGCSGMIDDKDRIKPGIAHWAARFAEQGYVVLAVDSFNPRGHSEVCTKSDRPILESRERPRDAYGALKYLSAQSYINKDRVFLMGFSNGATGTLYAVDADGKPFKLAKDAGITFRAAMAFYPGCSNANKNRLKTAIPLGIFIGADDDWTPAGPCRELIALNKSRGLEVAYFDYPGAYHGFDVPGSKVRVRKDVRMSNRPGLADGVHVGGNENARKAAEKDVDDYLSKR
jgi:dienelactone hydrolase